MLVELLYLIAIFSQFTLMLVGPMVIAHVAAHLTLNLIFRLPVGGLPEPRSISLLFFMVLLAASGLTWLWFFEVMHPYLLLLVAVACSGLAGASYLRLRE